jgi:hypothetical protein
MDRLKNLTAVKTFFRNRTNLILVGILLLLIAGSIFAINAFLNKKPSELPVEEIDLAFEAEGPYAILNPRRDGSALTLNIFRVSSYESINYELAYQSTLSETENTSAEEGSGTVDRGVQGTLNTDSKKSEYQQEILFGTCSQGFTEGNAHCVFDKNVENGTLILKIKKPFEKGDKTQKVYRMVTSWHLQKPDVALGVITSADSHFAFKTEAERAELATTGYTITNELTGVPKLPDGKKVFGKVYALNVPTARSMPQGEVTMETIDNPPTEAKIFYYEEGKNEWIELETKIESNKLTSNGPGAGIYAVLINR